MTSILPSLPISNTANIQANSKTATDSNATPFDSVLEKQMAPTDQSAKQDHVKKTSSKADTKATDNEEDKTDTPQTVAQPDMLSFIMSAQNVSTPPTTTEPPEPIADTEIQHFPESGDNKNQKFDLASLSADKSAEKLLSADQLAQAKAALSEIIADEQTAEDFSNQAVISPTAAQPSTVSSASPTNPTVATTPTYHVAPSLNQSGWDQAISQRVVWMANQQLQNATITINPEHLGPIQVQVQIDNQQQASVQFISAQPEVRQALQNAIPVLSNMLEQSGIQLGHSDVSSQGSGSNGQQQGKANPFQGSEVLIDNSLIDLPTGNSSGQGLINVSA